ncbi:MAG: ABC transporter ATP-binding protein [Methanomassiliicoccales archaeon]
MLGQVKLMAIIKCSDVKKTYVTGEVVVEALKGVSLEVRQGEMVAIMGPSGCGKTTLLNCLSGIDDVTAGKIEIEETDLTTLNDDQKSRFRAQRMGFIFQFYNLLPVLTAIENVELPLLICGEDPSKAREKAMALLTLVGLKDRAMLRPNALSGGERQRVTIARALVKKAPINIFDDSFSALDYRTDTKLRQALKQDLGGSTVIIVTQRVATIMNADRILVVSDGRIIEDGDHRTLMRKKGHYHDLYVSQFIDESVDA